MRKASTVAEAPNRQASAISTASPASGLASDSPASPVADRATAWGPRIGSVTDAR